MSTAGGRRVSLGTALLVAALGPGVARAQAPTPSLPGARQAALTSAGLARPTPPPIGPWLTAPVAPGGASTPAPPRLGPGESPGLRAVASSAGAVGLLRTSAAQVGAVGHLRLAVHGELFSGHDLLLTAPTDAGQAGDRNLRLRAGLSVGLTPHRLVELFATLGGSANRNRRLCERAGGAPDGAPGGEACVGEPGRADPEVIKAFGRLSVGGKVAAPLGRGLHLGGEAGLRFWPAVSGVWISPRATSGWLSALGTWDLGQVTRLPLRLHGNAGFYLDRSYRSVEIAGVVRSSQLVTAFAHGLGRSRVRTAWALEAPLAAVLAGLSLRPFVEYHLEVITAGIDPVFGDFAAGECRGTPSSPCRDNRDQQWITAGLQVQTGAGFTVVAGVDVALRSPGLPFGPRLAPWNLVVGLAHTLDVGGPRLIAVDRPVPVPMAVLPDQQVVMGRVLDAADGHPIDGAVVGVTARPHARVASDPDGAFATVPLPAGPATLEASAPGFRDGRAKVVVPPPGSGAAPEVVVALVPRGGQVRLRLRDPGGQPVNGRVSIAAADQPGETGADIAGEYTTHLRPGLHHLRFGGEGRLARAASLTISDGQDQELAVTLRARPPVPAVTLDPGSARITLPPGPTFVIEGGIPSATLTPEAEALLDELIDLLLGRPELRRVRLEAHWDRSLPPEVAQQLTDDQAGAVAGYLSSHGLPESRVVALGMGSARPLPASASASAVAGASAARHRRLELRVLPR